jgi:hypothetical protein
MEVKKSVWVREGVGVEASREVRGAEPSEKLRILS